MKPGVKARWVKALRSGKYEQEQEALKIEVSKGKYAYCCLGVLCEVQGRKIGASKSHFDLGELSQQELNWWGLSSEEMTALIIMNDTDGCTFSEIADYIEENL